MEANKQTAIVVGVHLKNHGDREEDFYYSMEELKGLAAACDIEVVGEITQNLQQIHRAHYLGMGKVQELICMIEETDVDQVIFNDELSPSQIRVLEQKLDRRVLDRTMLILDIFAERASTREAKLQVEVAQLQYLLPRLVGLRKDLGRQGGGAGLKNRGAGETKLELDRRKIEEKIAMLSKELEALVAQRQTQRSKRQKNDMPVVSLVGYTNAGKSTLMNALIDHFHPAEAKRVFEKDMLFATLETSVRNIKLPDNKTFLLTDTVGFIDKLPHHLVKAFRSTLEEAIEADLLIHVVDCADPRHEQLMEVTEQTLQDIGAVDIPVIYAFNKADLTEMTIPYVEQNKVYLSAKQGCGLDELVALISRHIFGDYMECELLIPFDQGQLVSYFNDHAHVISTEYEQEGTRITVQCRQSDYEKYKEYESIR